MKDSERRTLQFIRRFIARHGYSPKLDEIASGIGISSKGSVSRYVDALINQGLLVKEVGQQRGLRLAEASLPLLGQIAAGRPIEAIAEADSISLQALFDAEHSFVLRVKGDSMRDEGILDGDYVVCRRADTAKPGDIVIALIDSQEATLKYFYQEGGQVKLVPANSSMQPMLYDAERVQVQGVFKALLRFA